MNYSMNEYMSDISVCRTAPATPGLLNRDTSIFKGNPCNDIFKDTSYIVSKAVGVIIFNRPGEAGAALQLQ